MSDVDPTAQDEFREFLLDLLAKSQHGKVDQIITEFTAHLDREFATVEIHHSHIAVEMVEAYGLEIELDAVGNAVTVSTNAMGGFFAC